MKLKHILVLAATTLIAAFGCKKPVELGPEKLEISQTTPLQMTKEGGDVTINLTATVDWTVKDINCDWVRVNPVNGKAAANAQTVSISVLPNEGGARSIDVTFYGNIMCNATLTINQEGAIAAGDGTKEHPYSASEAKAKASELADGDKIENVYVQGKVSSIKSIALDFGNAEYSISNDGTTNDEFIIYRGYSLGGAKFTKADEIKLGDDVIVVGAIVNFKGNTPEMTTGSKIVSLNGKVDEGSGSDQGGDTDYNNAPAKTVAEFIAAADENTYYKLTGTVSGFNSQYCSFDLTDETGKIYVYSVDNKADWSDKISNGGTVVLAGKFLDYHHATDSSKDKKEVVNAVILSFTAGEGGSTGGGNDDDDDNIGTPAGKGTEADPFNIAAVITKYKESGVSTDEIFVKGIITEIYKMPSNHNTADIYISDTNDGAKLYVYHLNNFGCDGKGDGGFAAGGLVVGDTVVIKGQIAEYNKSVQISKAFLVSLNGETDGGEGGDDGEDTPPVVNVPTGSVTLSFPDDNKANNKTNQYTNTWIAKVGDSQFELVAFSNNNWGWTNIRCGRKKDASVATIINKTALPKLSSIVVTVDEIIEPKVVNKAVLNIYSDVAKTTVVVSDIEVVGGFSKGEMTYTVPAEVVAEGLYYELLFDTAAHSDFESQNQRNGLIQISKIIYVAAE